MILDQLKTKSCKKFIIQVNMLQNYTVVISLCFVCSLNFAPNRQRNKAKYDDNKTNAKPGDQRTNK